MKKKSIFCQVVIKIKKGRQTSFLYCCLVQNNVGERVEFKGVTMSPKDNTTNNV